MKNLPFFIFLLILYWTNQGRGQEFAPVGTIWTYGYGTSSSWPIQYEPYYMEVKEEVEFKNKLCKSIVRTSYKGESEEVDLLYQDGAKVYFYKKELDSFLLLFDFGAEQYDTLQIGLDRYYDAEEPYTIKVIIDSIGFETYCGEELKVWHLSNSDESQSYYFDSKVIEGIGFLHSFHPVNGLFCGDIGSLRCFESTNYSCKLVDIDCDTVYFTSKISTVDIENDFKIYPNPASDYIEVILKKMDRWSKWEIINVSGERELRGAYSDMKKIDVSALSPGMYFLQLTDKSGRVITNKFAKY